MKAHSKAQDFIMNNTILVTSSPCRCCESEQCLHGGALRCTRARSAASLRLTRLLDASPRHTHPSPLQKLGQSAQAHPCSSSAWLFAKRCRQPALVELPQRKHVTECAEHSATASMQILTRRASDPL